MSSSSSKQKRISQFFTPAAKKAKVDVVESDLDIEYDSDEVESDLESEVDRLDAVEHDQVVNEAGHLAIGQDPKELTSVTRSDSPHVAE